MFRYRERLRAGEDRKHRHGLRGHPGRRGRSPQLPGAVIVAFLALILSTLGRAQISRPGIGYRCRCHAARRASRSSRPWSRCSAPKVFWPSKSWRREATGARFAAIGAALGRHPALFAVASGGADPARGRRAGLQADFDLHSAAPVAELRVAPCYSKQLHKGLPAGTTEPTEVLSALLGSAPLPASEVAGYRTALSSCTASDRSPRPRQRRTRPDRRLPGDAVLKARVQRQAVSMLRPARASAHAARAARNVRARRRHHRGLRRHPESGQPRLRRRVPGRRGHHPADPDAAAAQRGRAVVPADLGRPRLRLPRWARASWCSRC